MLNTDFRKEGYEEPFFYHLEKNREKVELNEVQLQYELIDDGRIEMSDSFKDFIENSGCVVRIATFNGDENSDEENEYLEE